MPLGDPDIVGHTISLNDVTHTVVGIAPNGFSYPLDRPEVALYLPLGYHAAAPGWVDKRTTRPGMAVTALLRPGVSIEQARANMAAVTPAAIQRVVSGLVHDRPIYNFRTMKQQLGQRSSNRRASLPLQKLVKEPFCRTCDAMLLNEDADQLPILVHGPPEIVPLAPADA